MHGISAAFKPMLAFVSTNPDVASEARAISVFPRNFEAVFDGGIGLLSSVVSPRLCPYHCWHHGAELRDERSQSKSSLADLPIPSAPALCDSFPITGSGAAIVSGVLCMSVAL